MAKPSAGEGVATRVRSGSPQANEMVQWTISSDERRELGRAAGPKATRVVTDGGNLTRAIAAALQQGRLAKVFADFGQRDEEHRQRAGENAQRHRPGGIEVGAKGDDGRHQHTGK